MKIYGNLVDEIADLHRSYAPSPGFRSGPLIVPGNWIPAVVDTTTFAESRKLPVIVAVGANYATGPLKLPTGSSAKHRTAPPWVEDTLGSQRGRVLRFLDACGAGRTTRHWKGLLPFDPNEQYHVGVAGRLVPPPHFVMANLSPWITTKDWAPIRDASLEDMFDILAAPGMGGRGVWGYFEDLRKCVGPGAIWIGHGNAEIYGLFHLLCRRFDIDDWFFDSNLSYPSQMILKSIPVSTKP